jgi:hypothetical protein
MRERRVTALGIILMLAVTAIQPARAERWVQAGPTNSSFWYDADSIRQTTDHLIGFWVSTGPNRTSPGTEGVTNYPTYSIINCRERTAGSKMSLDLGQTLQRFAATSGRGELIEKLCS